MEWPDFVLKLEHSIATVVQGAAPHSWDEDHISYSVLDVVRSNLNGVHIRGFHRPCRIAAQAYKLRGTSEHRYGDIAVLVRITSWDADVLEGIGFLEAKKKSLSPPNFEAFNMKQARRISRSAPRAQLLLYDAADITGFADGTGVLVHPFKWHPQWIRLLVPKTHALCTPLSTAIHVGRCTPALYKYGIPLSLQIASRYLRGFDLEFGKAPLAAVRGFAAGFGGVTYILAIGVSLGGDGEPSLPEVNSNLYGAVEGGAA